MKVGENNYYYAHDHLYSPAVLTDSSGTVIERYEYDAYGKPTIWNAGFTTERANSNYGNPYLFTGRRVDILDSGSLKIQYNRNRYYDYYSGRWLTHDPLGITPNAQLPNKFGIIGQNKDGMNLYEAFYSNPSSYFDPFGLEACSCGPDVTLQLMSIDNKVDTQYLNWMLSLSGQLKFITACTTMWHTGKGWDIPELKFQTAKYRKGHKNCKCGAPRGSECKGTVTVSGKCYHSGAVNFYLWGKINALCNNNLSTALSAVALWKAYKSALYWGKVFEGIDPPYVTEAFGWTTSGYFGIISSLPPSTEPEGCKPSKCKWTKPFTYNWGLFHEG